MWSMASREKFSNQMQRFSILKSTKINRNFMQNSMRNSMQKMFSFHIAAELDAATIQQQLILHSIKSIKMAWVLIWLENRTFQPNFIKSIWKTSDVHSFTQWFGFLPFFFIRLLRLVGRCLCYGLSISIWRVDVIMHHPSKLSFTVNCVADQRRIRWRQQRLMCVWRVK